MDGSRNNPAAVFVSPKVVMPGYGLVLLCPKCPPKDYYGMLKTPSNKAAPCPNCGTPLVAKKKAVNGHAE